MVTAPPRPTQRQATAAPPAPGRSAYELTLPWLAGLTVVCSSTALGGVITGGSWLGYVLLIEIVVICTGLLLRLLRVPTVLVAIGQMFALCCVTVSSFTDEAISGFLPGTDSLGAVADLLGRSVEVIRNGVPPVEPSPPVLCLAGISVGLVAIIVDVLVVPGQAPAAVGLMLLCVYAVPASLSDEMLPWWTFVLGALAFTLLLGVDRLYLQRTWRGNLAGNRMVVGEQGPPAAAIVSVATVLALLAGLGLTAVGTDGRLPGSDGDGNGNGPAQLGIKPFTTLRGLLDQQQNATEMFRVRGFGNDAPYLRALTLRDYVPNKGWQASTSMAKGVSADTRPLPGSDISGETTKVNIESVNWQDVWLPTYGKPKELTNLAPGWRYDAASGIVYSQRPRNPRSYTEQAQLDEPSSQELRNSPQGQQVDPVYTRVSGVDPRVVELAKRLTVNAPTTFDKAAALYRYFVVSGGFTYSTETAAETDSDALADFLLNGKKGFCEQYASAMAVMLRTLDVPARVVIGFTPGQQKNGYRSITSTDAHAWVEVYFSGYGWQTFDPTPLTDGRGRTPAYLESDSNGGSSSGKPDEQPGEQSPSTGPEKPSTPEQDSGGQQQIAEPSGGRGSGPGVGLWLLLGALVLAIGGTVVALLSRPARRVAGAVAAVFWMSTLVLAAVVVSWWFLVLGVLVLVALAPLAMRERFGRTHVARAAGAGSDAVEAAWAELADQSRDRGVTPAPHETLRGAAETMIRLHGLDAEGQRRMRELVTVAERAWYRGDTQYSPGAALDGVLAALRRCAPLGWRDRLLPRSVLHGRSYLRWLPGSGDAGSAGGAGAAGKEESTDRHPVGGSR